MVKSRSLKCKVYKEFSMFTSRQSYLLEIRCNCILLIQFESIILENNAKPYR